MAPLYYRALSRRMKDRYDIFGSLPDAIEDDWIESEENLAARMNACMHLLAAALPAAGRLAVLPVDGT